jgi:hypothetical protein
MFHINTEVEEEKVERSKRFSNLTDMSVSIEEGGNLLFSLLGKFQSFLHYGFIHITSNDVGEWGSFPVGEKIVYVSTVSKRTVKVCGAFAREM